MQTAAIMSRVVISLSRKAEPECHYHVTVIGHTSPTKQVWGARSIPPGFCRFRPVIADELPARTQIRSADAESGISGPGEPSR
jgi:hypothetical protein